MLQNLTNFFNLITNRKVKTQLDNTDLIAVGTKDPNYTGGYQPTAITYSDLAAQIGGGGGGSHYIGELVGGGIVVALWKEGSTEKALIASLTNLSTGIQWTFPVFQSTLIGPAAQSFSDGLSNTNAIIAQTTFPAANTYAAGLARLHADGGYNDWYLPSSWELNMCYNSAAIVNKVLGTNSFIGNAIYWSSTESNGTNAWNFNFGFGSANNFGFKSNTYYVRAVRTHTF
jgi:hypothetical protein